MRFPSTLIAGIFLLIISCTQKEKPVIDSSLDRSLLLAERLLKYENEETIRAMGDKADEPDTRWKAAIYFPLMKTVDSLCRSVVDSLSNWEQPHSQSQIRAARVSFVLNSLQSAILQLSPIIKQDLGGLDFISARPYPNATAPNAFDGVDTVSKQQLLQVRLNLASYENRVLHLLFEQVGAFIEDYSRFSAIVAQNSNALLPGEKLEINAGIGSFSTQGNPQFLINGKNVPVGVDGQATGAVSAPQRPGMYSVPVSISFTDQDGKKLTITKTVEYRVLPFSIKDNPGSKGPQ